MILGIGRSGLEPILFGTGPPISQTLMEKYPHTMGEENPMNALLVFASLYPQLARATNAQVG